MVKKQKSRKNNPTEQQTKMSIESNYEAAANNYSHYSTEELGRLEIASDEDPNLVIQNDDQEEHHATIGKKKIKQKKK
ncbi:hypothetical protein [Haloplasma contractile]|uniref:Uncharacterized protein n=1 Tax=Haloplasma contractile SSD-17B TaxID=1033810 RepID=U2FSI3_9MOLU|nr:hypothetical protein [Haloplasma contractile]ERJ13889.1 hypothetical protein HLPCO_000555 [Haloplasma contractile SSD-17B]